jgi:hypothetical protein
VPQDAQGRPGPVSVAVMYFTYAWLAHGLATEIGKMLSVTMAAPVRTKRYFNAVACFVKDSPASVARRSVSSAAEVDPDFTS